MGALGKLAKLSPEKLWGLIRHPGMIPVLASAPRPLAPVDAAAALYPDRRRDELDELRLEFLRSHEFFAQVDEAMLDRRRRRAFWREWYEFFYITMRVARPQRVVETGVFDGQSSAVILLALQRNGGGELHSIDLPAVDAIAGSTDRMSETTLPPGCQPGWCVPAGLRAHYHLELGDARTLLPELLGKLGQIDVFFHDSLHTYEHMYFEYTTAWPHLAAGGLLLSDDIFWNPAMHRFAGERQRRYVRVGGFGGLRK